MAQKIDHLLDNWGSAEDLLKQCNPEKLGRVLLDYLDDSQRIALDDVISWRALFGVLDWSSERFTRDKKSDIRRRYPENKEEEVLYALMEGWQWLIVERLIAPTPKMRGQADPISIPTYFVTRRGKSIKETRKETG